ncbi:MAG: transposase [Magnetococcales bacterium]|nr:transposase [Magnetococcales bacterium]
MEKAQTGDPLAKMPDMSRQRLRESWPHLFRIQVLGMVPDSFCAVNDFSWDGASNSMSMLVFLSVLKELLALNDADLESALRFDLRFHYALGLDMDETDFNQWDLYGFRRQVVLFPEIRQAFDLMVNRILGQLGPYMGRPDLDAQVIRSNMAMQMRLGAITGSIETFLNRLESASPADFQSLPPLILERYQNRQGAFANVSPRQCRGQLELALLDADSLVARFAWDEAVGRLESFQVIQRLQNVQSESGPPPLQRSLGSLQSDPHVDIRSPAVANMSIPA